MLPPGEDLAAADAARWLTLQRAAGNVAVAALLEPKLRRGASPTVQRRKGATSPDAPVPERTGMDITGRYERNVDEIIAVHQSGTLPTRATMQLNQAGHHVEGWWQRHEPQGPGRAQRLYRRRISADLDAKGPGMARFRGTMTSSGGTAQAMTIEARSDGDAFALHVRTEDGWSARFDRWATTARISDEAIEAMPEQVRDLVRAHQTAPLDVLEESHLQQECQALVRLTREYLGTTRENIARDAVAMRIDARVRELFQPLAPEQHPLAVQLTRQRLLGDDLTEGSVTRPVWDWLQIIVVAHPQWTPFMQNRLGMSTTGIGDGNAPQHQYRWQFTVGGLAGDVGVGLGAFLGSFTIQKLAPERWTQTYFALMGQVSGGASVGVTLGVSTSWSQFSTPFPWTSGNFRGPYVITSTAAAGHFGGGGGYSPAAFINFYGDGTFPVLSADASGWMGTIGAGAGAEMSETVGRLWGGRDEAVRSATPDQQLSGEAAYATAGALHFPVDDPSLTEEGWAAIRRMAAVHRAAFENPATTVSVDGYASPSGPEARNEQLASLRAQNTIQALRDVLGDAFAAETVTWASHGEQAALQAGVPQRTESQEWRRVSVSVNGRVVLVL